MVKMDKETFKLNFMEALDRYGASVDEDKVDQFLNLNFKDESELSEWTYGNFDDFASSMCQAYNDRKDFWDVVEEYDLKRAHIQPTDLPTKSLVKIIQNVLAWATEHDKEFVSCMVDAMELDEDEIEAFELEEYFEEEEY